MLDNQELEAIRKRVDAATPGPWKVYEKVYEENAPALTERLIGTAYDHPQSKSPMPIVTQMTLHPKYQPNKRVSIDAEDAEFIAHAREDIPKLLEYIDELKAEAIYIAYEREKYSKRYFWLLDYVGREKADEIFNEKMKEEENRND